jgi:diguanylate cyclase (GGDEF)-like protein/PAS domain S-box-containing protein
MSTVPVFKGVIDEIEQGVIFLSPKTEILYINDWIAKVGNVDRNAVVEQNFLTVFPLVVNTRVWEAVTDALIFNLSSYISANFYQSPFEFYKHGLFGIEFYRIKQVICIKPLELADGKQGCQILIQDVSDVIEREASLQKASKELNFTATALSREIERLTTVLNSTASAIIGFHHNGRIELANQSVQNVFGYDPDEIKRIPFHQLFLNPSHLQAPAKNIIDEIVTSAQHQHQHKTLETRAYKKDGTPFYVEIQTGARAMQNSEHFMVIARDITEQIHVKHSLKNSENRFKILANIAPVGIFYTDIQGSLRYVNTMWALITGLSWEGANNKNWHDVIFVKDKHRIKNLWQYSCQFGESFSAEFRIETASKIRWVLCQIREEFDAFDHIIGYVGTLTDITAQQELREQIETLAFYDPLTALANRRLFRDRLNQALQSAQDSKNKLALLSIDLDRFKRINDSLGHDAGDLLLTHVASRLKEFVRKEDTVARLGGDEFVIILNNIKSPDVAGMIADKIIHSIRQPILLTEQTITMTVSVGIAISPDDATDAQTLLKYADMAMYGAKTSGRNRFGYYTSDMSLRNTQRLALENELNIALIENQFFLLYQPQYNVRTGRFIGMEALIRWQSPTRGLVPPDVFIEVAEQSGQIVAIGDWVLVQSCIDMKNLLDQGCVDDDNRVCVNLSSRQFLDPRLPYVVYQALQQTGLPAKNLELEITESMLMEHLDVALSLVRCLKGFGVYLAIDDFGTGYSSLGYLKQLPVDTLKIDRCFINDLVHSDQDKCIVSAVIAMAHKLNLMVIAEGIEFEEQLVFLRENGCDFAQGFFMSKPLTIEKVTENLRTEAGYSVAMIPYAAPLRGHH